MLLRLYVFVFGALMCFSAAAAVTAEKVADGYGVIWSLAQLPDGRWLIGEKSGKVTLTDPNFKNKAMVSGVPSVVDAGQGGFMDLAVHPEFSKNNFVYMTYVATSGGEKTTHLARAVFRQNQFQNLKVLWKASPELGSNQHFGSRILFDGNGFIYFTMGERNERKNAQDLSNHLGAVMRLHEDGRVPTDNPFVNQSNSRPEIWSYGHRNPQGIAMDMTTRNIWVNEHGPRGGDEINLIKKGTNYGWPVITYGREYWGPKIGTTQKASMEQPVKYFVPSIAPSSLLFYSGKKYEQWKGNLFSGALALTHLNRYDLKTQKEERFFENLGERIRDVVESSTGDIYFTTDSGQIYRVVVSDL